MLIAQTPISRTALKGHIAVITGAGQGIGRETARALAYLGAAVVIAEINETGLETQHVITSEGGTALFVTTDVADPGSMEDLHRRVQETFGDVDILVNNAAAFTTKPVLEHTVEEWDRIFAVNVRGAFLGIKAFLPTMLARKKGVIVTMESFRRDAFSCPIPRFQSWPAVFSPFTRSRAWRAKRGSRVLLWRGDRGDAGWDGGVQTTGLSLWNEPG